MKKKSGKAKRAQKNDSQKPENEKQNRKISFQTKEDEISKSIIEQIENRRSTLTKEPKYRLMLLGLMVVLLNLVFTLLVLNVKIENKGFIHYFQIVIFQVATFISLGIVGKLLKRPPSDEQLDDFLWRQGLAVFRLKVILAVILALWAPFLLLSKVPFFYNPVHTIALILAPISYLLYFASIVLVSKRPRLLKSIFTKLGTIFLIAGIRSLASIVFPIYFSTKIPHLLIIYIYLNVKCLFEMFSLFSFYRPLDRLQESVLSIIPPSNLYDILATDLQKKIDQKNAAIIEESLYKHLSEETRVGVRKYLIETRLKEINDERRYSPISILVILASLALFFFSSIGEGLIQDLFLDKVKAFLCGITGSLFCK